MITVKSGFKKIRFEHRRLTKDTSTTLKLIFTEAIHAFMVEMINHVPVQTGMARASIKPLAEWLSRQALRGVGPVTVPIDPKRTGPWASRRLASGPSFGKHEPFLTIRGNQYGINTIEFEWGTEVPHWTYLEDGSNPRVVSAPWHATEEGRKRFRDVLAIAMKYRMPKIKDYITIDERTVETQDE